MFDSLKKIKVSSDNYMMAVLFSLFWHTLFSKATMNNEERDQNQDLENMFNPLKSDMKTSPPHN